MFECIHKWTIDHWDGGIYEANDGLFPFYHDKDDADLLLAGMDNVRSWGVRTDGFERCFLPDDVDHPRNRDSLAYLRSMRTLFEGSNHRLADLVFEAVTHPARHDPSALSKRRATTVSEDGPGFKQRPTKGTDVAAEVGCVLRPWAHYAKDPQWAQEGIARALALPSPDFRLIGAFLKGHDDLPYSEALRDEGRRKRARRRLRRAFSVVVAVQRLHRRVEATRLAEREADWAEACASDFVLGSNPAAHHAIYDLAWEVGRERGLKRRTRQ